MNGRGPIMKKKRLLLTALLIIAGFAIAAMGLMAYTEKNLEKLANSTVKHIDITALEDGVYKGSYGTFPVSAEVRVTVKGQRITGIDLLKHNNGQGAPAEVIPSRVVEAQSLDVDAVSGATYSSKVILKAIEKALEGAGR
jgi:uncharacterized protein with FMN-binding domain